jgi:hypothetical protein
MATVLLMGKYMYYRSSTLGSRIINKSFLNVEFGDGSIYSSNLSNYIICFRATKYIISVLEPGNTKYLF